MGYFEHGISYIWFHMVTLCVAYYIIWKTKIFSTFYTNMVDGVIALSCHMTPCMWTVDSTWHNMFHVLSICVSPNHSHSQTYDVSLHAIICFMPCCMSSLCIGTPPAGSDCNCHWPIPTVAHFQLYCILSSCDTTYIVFLSGLGCQLLKHIISCLSMETLVFLYFI